MTKGHETQPVERVTVRIRGGSGLSLRAFVVRWILRGLLFAGSVVAGSYLMRLWAR